MNPINARPGPNSNDKREFCAAALGLQEAINQTAMALNNIRAEIMHGRNYQHCHETDWRQARQWDLDRLEKKLKHLDALREFVFEVAEPGLVAHPDQKGD